MHSLTDSLLGLLTLMYALTHRFINGPGSPVRLLVLLLLLLSERQFLLMMIALSHVVLALRMDLSTSICRLCLVLILMLIMLDA